MQNWKDLYLELGELLMAKAPVLKRIDLWRNQVDLPTQPAIPSPALFLGFKIVKVEDQGQNIQLITCQVDTYLYHAGHADFEGILNREIGEDFLKLLNDIFRILNGSSGTNYQNMRRTNLSSIVTESGANLYLQSFEMTLLDEGVQKTYVDMKINSLAIENGSAPVVE